MGGPLTKTFETGDGQRVLGSHAEITHENNNQKKNSVHFIINQEGVISQQQRGGLNFITVYMAANGRERSYWIFIRLFYYLCKPKTMIMMDGRSILFLKIWALKIASTLTSCCRDFPFLISLSQTLSYESHSSWNSWKLNNNDHGSSTLLHNKPVFLVKLVMFDCLCSMDRWFIDTSNPICHKPLGCRTRKCGLTLISLFLYTQFKL